MGGGSREKVPFVFWIFVSNELWADLTFLSSSSFSFATPSRRHTPFLFSRQQHPLYWRITNNYKSLNIIRLRRNASCAERRVKSFALPDKDDSQRVASPRSLGQLCRFEFPTAAGLNFSNGLNVSSPVTTRDTLCNLITSNWPGFFIFTVKRRTPVINLSQCYTRCQSVNKPVTESSFSLRRSVNLLYPLFQIIKSIVV